MSNDRQLNYVNNLQNRDQNLYYIDDVSELNSINLKENDKIYAINNNKLFQMEIVDKEEELSGSIVSFNGRNNTKIKSLVANIEPQQDLHGYDHPWPAGGMGNLAIDILIGNAPSITHNGVTLTVKDGKFVTSGTATASGGRLQLRTDPFTLPAGTYTASQSGYNGDIFVQRQSGNSIIVAFNNAGNVFTLEEDTTVFIGFNVNTDGTYNYTTEILINTGSTKGTWYPYSNECPISGWTGAEIEQAGKNMVNPLDFVGRYEEKTFTVEYHDADITIHFASPGDRFCEFLIPVKSGETYFISWSSVGSSVSYRSYDTKPTTAMIYTGNIIGPNKTIRPIGNWIGIQLESTTDVTIKDFQVSQKKQISATFPSAASTVYDGMLTLNPDRTGTLMVDRAFIQDISTQASNIGQYTVWGSTHTYTLYLPDSTGISDYEEIASDIFPAIANRGSVFNGTVLGMTLRRDMKAIYFSLPGVENNIQDFITAVTGHQILYPIAPQTIQLTAEQVSDILSTFYGTNNIWSNTGDITVKIAEKGITAFELEPHI